MWMRARPPRNASDRRTLRPLESHSSRRGWAYAAMHRRTSTRGAAKQQRGKRGGAAIFFVATAGDDAGGSCSAHSGDARTGVGEHAATGVLLRVDKTRIFRKKVSQILRPHHTVSFVPLLTLVCALQSPPQSTCVVFAVSTDARISYEKCG